MKHVLAAAAAAALIACSGGNAVKIAPPELEFVQLSGPADQNYTPGEIEVQYGLRITNRATESITLRRVQIQSVAEGGPYRLRPETYHFDRTVLPQEFQDVTFWAKAYAEGDAFASDANAPVTIRATAIFDSPGGTFRRVFTKVLEQRGR